MEPITITCPSGLEGKLRPLKVKDEALTKDAKLVKSGELVYELAKRCWVEATSQGPYDLVDKAVDWRKVMQGDAFAVFLEIRRITYGDEYDFTCQCKSCRSTINWTMKFSELDVRELSEEGEASWKTGEPIAVETESGLRVTGKILTGEDDKYIARLQEGREMSQRNATLCQRIVSIEGVDTKKPFEKIRWVESLDAGDADELLELLEWHDCGVDTEIPVTCANCYYDQTVTLPLGASFFLKKLRKKAKRKTRKQLQEDGGSETTST